MPWQSVPILPISPDALTAKVLCRRHNEALSPLDSEALRVFRALGKATDHAGRRSLSKRPWATIVSGEALELWALKTIAGFCASGMDFRFGGHRLADFDLPLSEIAQTLSDPAPRSFVRLEIPTDKEAHEAQLGRSAVSILWDVDADLQQLSAMFVRMHGVALKFHLKESSGANPPFRPHILDLIGPLRKARLYFGWPERTAGGYAFIRVKPAPPVNAQGGKAPAQMSPSRAH